MTEFGEGVTSGSGSGSDSSSSSSTRSLEIGFFFDGTLNNLANARGEGEGSYENAPSNVALLSRLYATTIAHPSDGSAWQRRSVYLDGIGTTSGEHDNVLGMATGTGRTGVSARVHAACRRLVTEAATREYEEIVVDAFGFSRGSAAARYFVNCLNRGSFERVTSGFLMDGEPTVLGRVVTPPVYVRFLGIFDSVAAIMTPEDGLEASDANNADVNMHLHDGSAERTYHLVAGNEYRRNFASNSICNASGVPPTGGTEITLPGVHSDVGGGYLGRGETVVCVRPQAGYYATRAEAEASRATLIHDHDEFTQRVLREYFAGSGSEFSFGYDQLQDDGPDMPGIRYSYFGAAVWRRPSVRAGLEKVALKLMHDEALRNDVPLGPLPSNADYAIPSEIRSIYSTLSSGGSLTDADLALLHWSYVHWSAHYGHEQGTARSAFTTPPRITTDGDLLFPHVPAPGYRRIVHPNDPSRAW